MKKPAWIAALLAAAALTGCAHYEHHKTLARSSDTPQITVKDGKLDITPSTLYFTPGQKDVKITWKLPAGQGLRFMKDGIVIEGEILDRVIRGTPNSVALDAQQREIINCEAAADGQSFTCLNRNSRPGIYKYTVRVYSGDKLLEKDPPIVNML